MTEQSILGLGALAAIVVVMVLYRVFWSLRREERRRLGPHAEGKGSSRVEREDERRQKEDVLQNT